MTINTNNSYHLSVVEGQGDTIEEYDIATGNVTVADRKITFEEKNTGKKFSLFWTVEHKLVSKDPSLVFQTRARHTVEVTSGFYCVKRFYPTGGVKYTGTWCKGKKCGLWHFYDKDGRLLNEVNYD